MYIGHMSRIGISAILAAGVAFGLASCSSHSVQGRGWLAGYHSEPEIGSRAYRSGGGEAPLGSSHVVASWYGPGYEGRRTASGDKFDPKHFSAASKTLRLGSIVRVTNLRNGRSVDVIINDRGPVAPGRSIDLSRAAAQQIGLTKNGIGQVKLTRLSE
jgi:Lytic transglycolase